jgi:hypothetical protein
MLSKHKTLEKAISFGLTAVGIASGLGVMMEGGGAVGAAGRVFRNELNRGGGGWWRFHQGLHSEPLVRASNLARTHDEVMAMENSKRVARERLGRFFRHVHRARLDTMAGVRSSITDARLWPLLRDPQITLRGPVANIGQFREYVSQRYGYDNCPELFWKVNRLIDNQRARLSEDTLRFHGDYTKALSHNPLARRRPDFVNKTHLTDEAKQEVGRFVRNHLLRAHRLSDIRGIGQAVLEDASLEGRRYDLLTQHVLESRGILGGGGDASLLPRVVVSGKGNKGLVSFGEELLKMKQETMDELLEYVPDGGGLTANRASLKKYLGKEEEGLARKGRGGGGGGL